MKQEFIEILNKDIPKHFKSFNSFARECGMSIHQFDFFRRRGGKIKAKNLIIIIKKMKKKAKYEIDIQNYIIAISWNGKGKNIKINSLVIDINTKEFSRIISAIFHDGSIAKDHRAYYINTDKLLRKIVCDNVFSSLGKIDFNLLEGKRIDFGKTMGEIIVGLFPEINGYRISRNYAVPNIYLNGTDEMKIQWIRQAFDDEGSVSGRNITLKLARDVSYFSRKERQNILNNPKKYNRYAPDLLLGLKTMLESLGIVVCGPHFNSSSPFIYRDKMGFLRISYQWHINISHAENLKKFYSIIGFSNPKKKEKLYKTFSNIKTVRPPYRKGTMYYLSLFRDIEKEIGYISSNEAYKRTGRSVITIRQWLRKLYREGFLINKSIKRGLKIYNITDKQGGNR